MLPAPRLPDGFGTIRRMVPVGILAGMMFLDGAPGSAYRFYRSLDEESAVPDSDTARRWDEAVWGPGESLVFHVHGGSDWSPHFESVDEVVSMVETAAGVWSRVATADLRMRVDVVAEAASRALDGVNLVAVGTEVPERNRARRWQVRDRATGRWDHVECDIELGQARLEGIADVDNPNRLSTVIHEIGHCLGLAHAAVGPTVRWTSYGWTDSSVWQKDPVMSYGVDIDNELTEDEVVGASLLRPAGGWLRSTGSISGRVLHDDGPAAFVSVHVLRTGGGSARPAVQVFTDEAGEFLAEGLAPGEYLLWIHPMLAQHAHPRLLREADPLFDLNDSLEMQPFVVRAREETQAGEFTLTRGRVIP